MTAFASVSDLAAGWRVLTSGEESVAGVLLGRAAERLSCYVTVDPQNAAQAALLKQFSCNMVRRAMEAHGDAFAIPSQPSGASVWAPENPAGDMWLTKAEKSELRAVSGQSGRICAMGPIGHEEG